MSRLIDKRREKITDSNSIISFETTGDNSWREWDRYLTIDGKKAYHIGNVCGTCSFFFERLEGANRSISSEDLVETLNQGITYIDDDVINKLIKIIPKGDYFIGFLESNPKIVNIGSKDDYFANEQVEDWGIDRFWGFPHHPRIRYYRDETRKLSSNSVLHEFLVPMYPQAWLNDEQVASYIDSISTGAMPTAISISVLDIKEHYDSDCAHWCLTHYIIDGHHKLFASSKCNIPISLISFISIDNGVSNENEIEEMMKALQVLP